MQRDATTDHVFCRSCAELLDAEYLGEPEVCQACGASGSPVAKKNPATKGRMEQSGLVRLPQESFFLWPRDVATSSLTVTAEKRTLSGWLDVWLPVEEYGDDCRELVAYRLMQETERRHHYSGVGAAFIAPEAQAAIWNSVIQELGYDADPVEEV